MCDYVDLHFGKRLRRRRRLLGLTQQEVGALCGGLRFQQIQKYESGVNRMSAATLWRVSCALGVNPSYFFEGLEEEAGEPVVAVRKTSVAA